MFSAFGRARSAISRLLKPDKNATSLLVIFIPSVDRGKNPIDQDAWVSNALEFLGRSLGGATAFPRGRGVWRDDERGGELIFDEPVIVQCYTGLDRLVQESERLKEFLIAMGRETNQGAVGYVIDREYFEIQFPLLSEGG